MCYSLMCEGNKQIWVQPDACEPFSPQNLSKFASTMPVVHRISLEYLRPTCFACKLHWYQTNHSRAKFAGHRTESCQARIYTISENTIWDFGQMFFMSDINFFFFHLFIPKSKLQRLLCKVIEFWEYLGCRRSCLNHNPYEELMFPSIEFVIETKLTESYFSKPLYMPSNEWKIEHVFGKTHK